MPFRRPQIQLNALLSYYTWLPEKRNKKAFIPPSQGNDSARLRKTSAGSVLEMMNCFENPDGPRREGVSSAR